MPQRTKPVTLLGLDADDTLWHNEQFYQLTQDRFRALLADHAEGDHVTERLLEAEQRNLKLYGFGIKGFTLSMIETALQVTGNKVPPETIKQILDAGRDLLMHPVETLPGVEDTLEELVKSYKLVLITKGDLFDQERKLAASGLGELFSAVEIVSDKTPQIYGRIFDEYGHDRGSCAMAGNSVKSDVLPALEAGGWAVHVPHEHVWAFERADIPVGAERFRQAQTISELPEILESLGEGRS